MGELDGGVINLCYAAVAISGVMTVGVVVVAAVCVVFILKVGNRHLRKIADELPKSQGAIGASQIPVSVLVALCEQAGISIEQLADYYKASEGERRINVERTFGSDNQTVQRYFEAENISFLKDGYAGEAEIKQLAVKKGN